MKKEALAKAAKFPGEGGFWVALTPPSQREGRQNHFLKVLQEKALCLGLSLGLGVTVAWLLTEILQFSLDF